MKLYDYIGKVDDKYKLKSIDSNDEIILDRISIIDLMYSLDIGIRNLHIVNYKLVERPADMCKYIPYISILVLLDCYGNNYLLAFDIKNKRLVYEAAEDIQGKALQGKINPDCKIEKTFDGDLKFCGLDTYTYNCSPDYLISNFDALLNNSILDSNLISSTVNLCRDYLNNLSDLPIIITSRGPIIDVTSWLTSIGLYSNDRLFNVLLKIENNHLYLGDRFKAYIPNLRDYKILISYNPYISKFELLFYSNTDINIYKIYKYIKLTSISLYEFSIEGVEGLRSGAFDNILKHINLYNQVSGGEDCKDSNNISRLSSYYNLDNFNYKTASLEELEFYYHVKYTSDKLNKLINNYRDKLNMLRLSNITGFDIEIQDGKAILTKVITTKSQVDIVIPDWIWDIKGNGLLPNFVRSASITFTRPLISSEILAFCNSLETVKLNNLMIHVSGTRGMFKYCSRLREVYFDEVFNLEDAESTHSMFSYCSRLEYKNIHSIKPFRTSTKCQDASYMFYSCPVIGDVDMSDWEFDIDADMFNIFDD